MRILEALHCVGFACASLSIGQDGGIVPLQDAPDNWLGSHRVNFLLSRVLIVDVVESELMDLEIARVAHVVLEILGWD